MICGDATALYPAVVRQSLVGRCWILLLLPAATVVADDIITTPITWDREISHERCASCYHDGGQAFSLMTYAAARPWAVAIKQEVLERQMPPWGAVKGFGDFVTTRRSRPNSSS